MFFLSKVNSSLECVYHLILIALFSGIWPAAARFNWCSIQSFVIQARYYWGKYPSHLCIAGSFHVLYDGFGQFILSFRLNSQPTVGMMFLMHVSHFKSTQLLKISINVHDSMTFVCSMNKIVYARSLWMLNFCAYLSYTMKLAQILSWDVAHSLFV